MKKKILAVFLTIAVIFSLCSCGSTNSASSESESETYTWRLSTNSPDGSPFDVLMDDFAEKVSEATDGHLLIEIYPGNVLGSDGDVIEMVKTGDVEMMWCGPANNNNNFNVISVSQIFCINTSPAGALGIAKTLYAEGYYDPDFKDNGLQVLSWFPGDGSTICTNKELTSLEDLSGMLIRAQGANATIASNMGASPVEITSSDVYMSLERGVAEGFISSPGAISSFSWYEVCDWCPTNLSFQSACNMLIVSDEVLENLPGDLRAILLQECSRLEANYMMAVYDDTHAALDKIRAGCAHPYEVPDTLLDEMKEACTDAGIAAFIEKMETIGIENGAEVVEAAQKAAAAYEDFYA